MDSVKKEEKELQEALRNFKTLLRSSKLEMFGEMLDYHINEMERNTASCQFSPIAQHMRELGDEAKGLDTLLKNNGDEIADSLSNVWGKIDSYIASLLSESCGCKLQY